MTRKNVLISLVLGALIISIVPSAAASQGNLKAATSKKKVAAPDWTKFLGKPTKALCNGKKYKLGFDIFSDNESFALIVRKGMKATVAKMGGCVSVEILSDNADPIKVQENLKIFIQKKFDGVMAAQVVAAAAPGAVRTMLDAKIPMVATFVVHPGVPFVDVDNRAAGQMAGEALMQQAKKRWGATVIPYLLIGTLKEGGPNSIARMDGYKDGVQLTSPAFPDANVIDVPTMGADPAKTNLNTANALTILPPNAKIIMGGINDDNTMAMVQAYKASGRDMSNMLAVGQGASNIANICSSELYGSVGYFPENYASYLIPALFGLINHQPVPNHVVLPTAFITKSNVVKYYPKQACK
jgi:ribose transport system substrate-binding protein